jgi:hypothetical protein
MELFTKGNLGDYDNKIFYKREHRMNYKEAKKYVINLLREDNKPYLPRTEIYIKNEIGYNWGWYFEYGVRGEMLAGGPDFGIMVHKLGYTYGLHYVGFPWDTGLGDHLSKQMAIEEKGNVLYPSRFAQRYFLKQVKSKEEMKNGSRDFISRSIKDGSYSPSIKGLKIDCCLTHQEALKIISKDSGRNIDSYSRLDMDKKYYEEVWGKWLKMVNTKLLDENWERYYEESCL